MKPYCNETQEILDAGNQATDSLWPAILDMLIYHINVFPDFSKRSGLVKFYSLTKVNCYAFRKMNVAIRGTVETL